MDPVKPNEGISTAGNPNPAASPAPTGAPVQDPVQTPVTPTTPEGTPTGGTPTPGATGEPTMVPLPALQEERAKKQELQSELDALRKAVSTPGQPAVEATPAPQQGDYHKQLEKLWETDPRKAVQAEVMMGITWMDNVNTSLEEQMDTLSTSDPTFNQYRPQVRSYLKTLPLEQRSKPGIAGLALAVVKGQNVDDIVERTKQDLYEKFKRGELAGVVNPPSTGTFTQPPVNTGVQASQEEINVAAAMGMSVEDYLQNKN